MVPSLVVPEKRAQKAKGTKISLFLTLNESKKLISYPFALNAYQAMNIIFIVRDQALKFKKKRAKKHGVKTMPLDPDWSFYDANSPQVYFVVSLSINENGTGYPKQLYRIQRPTTPVPIDLR